MPRLKRLHFRDVPGISPESRVEFGLNANVLLGREEAASGRGALLRWAAAVLTGDFSGCPDVPWSVDVVLATGEGPLALTFQRAEAGGPVLLLRQEGEEGEPIPLDTPPPEDVHAAQAVFTPARDLIGEVGAEGALRSAHFVPYALLHARAHAAPGEVARISLKHIPELASLWFHLDYERGEALMAPAEGGAEGAVGAVSFALQRGSGEVAGAEALTAAQRRLLSLHYYVACRSDVVFAEGVVEIIEGLEGGAERQEDALKDLLRHLLPGWGERLAARQSLLGADSSRLMYALGLRSAAAVRECAVLCSRDGQGRWLWRNMTEAEARKYFQFYERQFAHIDSLVRLW